MFRLCKQENTRNTQSNELSSKASCAISKKTGTLGQERWVVFQLVAPCTEGRFETLCSVTRVLPRELSVPRRKTALRNRGTHLEG